MEYTYLDFSSTMERLSICVNDNEIPRLDFLGRNKEIVINNLFSNSTQRSLFLHPENNLLFIESIIYYAFYTFVSENANNKNWLLSLSPGDMVIHLHENRRYEVIKINKQNMFIHLQGKNQRNTIPINDMWANRLTPYHGNATSLDGRGIRRKPVTERKFFSSLFDVDIELVKTTIEGSFVVVCSKQEADFIMDSVWLGVENKTKLKVSDLFPAAYYMSSEESINYAGNARNAEPVIKFTNKMSIARELVLEDEDKFIHAVIVNGSDYLLAGTSEINDLLVRRSLQNMLMLAPIVYGDFCPLLNQYNDINLYAWTSEALLSILTDINTINIKGIKLGYTSYLYKKIDNFIDQQVLYKMIESPYDKSVPIDCKYALQRLKMNLPESDEKDYFIKYGFSFLKLMEQACFTISLMESLISQNIINAVSPFDIYDKLHNIADLSNSLDNNYRDMKLVLVKLKVMYSLVIKQNSKLDYLTHKLKTFNYRDGDIAIVLPKNYYAGILKHYYDSIKLDVKSCDFTTANKFNHNKLYKKVFVFSLPESSHFNAVILSNADTVEYIGYLSEKWRLDWLYDKTSKLMDKYDMINSLEYDYYRDDEIPASICEDNNLEVELEEFIKSVSMRMSSQEVLTVEQHGGLMVEVKKYVFFETGERAFFTKYYSPYVYNSIYGTVEERDIDSLEPGDILIFSNIDDENKDIVDRVLYRLIDINQLNIEQREAYRKSKHWKKVLKNFINTHELTYAQIAKKLVENGQKKHEVTIKNWINEDSRIVGPRDNESFYAIAFLTDDSEMLNDPDSFCEACREVRSIRIKILKYIGKLIVHSFAGQSGDEFEQMLSSIAGDIKQMAILLHIDRIEDINNTVPAHMANRPQDTDWGEM